MDSRVTFQSTLPARGATDKRPRSAAARNHFNPRSPHGERRFESGFFGGGSEFQSTLPARGATRVHRRKEGTTIFQSTLPARGATGRARVKLDSSTFQSTLPARGATRHGDGARVPRHISIHAPRTGSDWRRATKSTRPRYFNPRSPHGERPNQAGHSPAEWRFQSTLPARGATFSTPEGVAPLEFQSTLPARGATDLPDAFKCAALFQSTLPARGATAALRVLCVIRRISIHAPRTGSDKYQRPSSLRTSGYFNPRSPHGERQRFSCPPCRKASFQSTLPARGATCNVTNTIYIFQFQSTLPARGAT